MAEHLVTGQSVQRKLCLPMFHGCVCLTEGHLLRASLMKSCETAVWIGCDGCIAPLFKCWMWCLYPTTTSRVSAPHQTLHAEHFVASQPMVAFTKTVCVTSLVSLCCEPVLQNYCRYRRRPGTCWHGDAQAPDRLLQIGSRR